jgi:hypothetical protein
VLPFLLVALVLVPWEDLHMVKRASALVMVILIIKLDRKIPNNLTISNVDLSLKIILYYILNIKLS